MSEEENLYRRDTEALRKNLLEL